MLDERTDVGMSPQTLRDRGVLDERTDLEMSPQKLPLEIPTPTYS